MSTESFNTHSIPVRCFFFSNGKCGCLMKTYVKYKWMSLQPVSAVSEQNLGNKSRVRPGSLDFVVMFRAPGGISR